MVSTIIIICLLVIIFFMWAERGRLFFLPSTKAAIRMAGIKGFLDGSLFHGYIYGRWLPQYIKLLRNLIPRFDARGKKWLSDTYHGKVLPHDLARSIVTLDKDIPEQDLDEKIIPYPVAKKIVLEASPDVVVTNCACRETTPSNCGPVDVCMAIGRPYTDFLLEHRPDSSRRVSQQEALKILAEVHKRGWVHQAFFKDACFQSFYVICNCDPTSCIAMGATMKHSIPMVSASGFVVEIDEEKCTGCSVCVKACPYDALREEADKAALNWDRCMGCGVCVSKCPKEAITLVLDEKKGLPMDVRQLTEGPNLTV